MQRSTSPILMIIKMNIDLERIADQCVNIAESASVFIKGNNIKPLEDFLKMSERVKTMVVDAINSFVKENTDLAKEVCENDEWVDDMNEKVIKHLITEISKDPGSVEKYSHLIRISHNFEKIADLATNIAEETVYVVLGEDIKHKKF